MQHEWLRWLAVERLICFTFERVDSDVMPLINGPMCTMHVALGPCPMESHRKACAQRNVTGCWAALGA